MSEKMSDVREVPWRTHLFCVLVLEDVRDDAREDVRDVRCQRSPLENAHLTRDLLGFSRYNL